MTSSRLYEAATTTTNHQYHHNDNDDIMGLADLRTRFAGLVNEEGIFPLFGEKQTESFQKWLAWKNKDHQRQAAVLILLCNVEGEPSILFTRRSRHLNEHAAEISFPGGHVEESETYKEAALREACEELLPPDGFLSNVQIIGRATQLPSIRGIPVTPVLGVLPSTELRDIHGLFPGSPDEVELVFSASVADLSRNEGSRPIESPRFGVNHGPTYATPHGTIWGLTAFILRPILHRILKPVYLKGGGADAPS